MDSKKIPFELDASYKFYHDSTLITELSLYRVKPVTFDIYLSLGIVIYGILLYVGTKLMSGATLAQAIKI